MAIFKSFVKTLLPRPVVRAIISLRIRLYGRGLTTQEVFTKIYKEKRWGESGDPEAEYYSGSGSHDPIIVQNYVDAVGAFLRSFEKKPDVVDIGCGDFFIGSQVRAFCGNYVACDIVEPLIAFNKEKYEFLDADFRVLDLTRDSLPRGDVLFLRQILRHLSNKQIQRALPEISSKFKYLIVTEHLPASDSFNHNRDIPTGPRFRPVIDSGVVLTSPPFDLKVTDERILCQQDEKGGIIKTILYRLCA